MPSRPKGLPPTLRRELERGGAFDDRGWLGAQIPQSRWAGPARVWVEGPPGDENLCYRWPTSKAKFDLVTPDHRLLDQFIALAEPKSTARDVLAYAEAWGVLQLCGHGAPHFHSLPFWPVDYTPVIQGRRRSTPPPAGRLCPTLSRREPDGRVYWEPVGLWLMWARRARALLQLRNKLTARESLRRADWASALEPCDDSGDWVSWYSAHHRILSPWQMLAWIADYWLVVDPVSASLSAHRERLQFQFRYRGLFGAIAAQLSMALARASHVGTCYECGRLHERSRKPRADRRTFCPQCRDAHKPQKWAKADLQERRRGADGSARRPG